MKDFNKEQALEMITKDKRTPLYVAKMLGVGAQRIFELLFESNHKEFIPLPPQEKIEKIVSLYKNGECVNSIVNIINEPKYKVTYTLKLNGFDPKTCFHRDRENKVNHNFFHKIDTEEKAYFLGFLYADGYLSYDSNKYQIDLGLQRCDEEILLRLQKAIEATWPIGHKIITNPSGSVSKVSVLRMYSKTLCEDLMKIGCTQAKTYKLSFPSEKYVPQDLRHHFIRGYFDGDGSVSILHPKVGRSRGKWNIQGAYGFLNVLKDVLIKDANFKHISFCAGHGNVYELGTGGNPPCVKLMKFMYKDATIFLQRKYERFLEIEKNYKKYSRVISKEIA